MVTDGQVSELRRWLAAGKSLAAAARMASMDKKTARSYRDDDRLPSQRKSPRQYRTRVDPFAEVTVTFARYSPFPVQPDEGFHSFSNARRSLAASAGA